MVTSVIKFNNAAFLASLVLFSCTILCLLSSFGCNCAQYERVFAANIMHAAPLYEFRIYRSHAPWTQGCVYNLTSTIFKAFCKIPYLRRYTTPFGTYVTFVPYRQMEPPRRTTLQSNPLGTGCNRNSQQNTNIPANPNHPSRALPRRPNQKLPSP